MLDAEIPITGAARDQHAALFGQGCTRPGMAKNTYGTGCFMLMNTGPERVASDNNLLMQFQSDMLESPTIRPTVSETTALGGAYLAGLAAGTWDTLDEIAELWSADGKADRRVEPQMSEARVISLVSRRHRALERSRAWHK